MNPIELTVHEDIAEDVEGLMQDIRKYKQCDNGCGTWFDPKGMSELAHGGEFCQSDCADEFLESISPKDKS
jgi:hypothetical protein